MSRRKEIPTPGRAYAMTNKAAVGILKTTPACERLVYTMLELAWQSGRHEGLREAREEARLASLPASIEFALGGEKPSALLDRQAE